MSTAKVVLSGDHQIVELPPDVRLPGQVVEIRRAGESILLVPMLGPWRALVDSLGQFSEDFMEEGRTQPPQCERAGLLL